MRMVGDVGSEAVGMRKKERKGDGERKEVAEGRKVKIKGS